MGACSKRLVHGCSLVFVHYSDYLQYLRMNLIDPCGDVYNLHKILEPSRPTFDMHGSEIEMPPIPGADYELIPYDSRLTGKRVAALLVQCSSDRILDLKILYRRGPPVLASGSETATIANSDIAPRIFRPPVAAAP